MTISHLIIFVDDKEFYFDLSQVYGEENAETIYTEVVSHTAQVSKTILAQRKCYYGSYIKNNDAFEDGYFEKSIQKGEDFGEKAYTAIKASFGEWASKVVLIKSSCYELNSGIIEEAFKALDSNDFVIGPNQIGGYYLIGMTDLNNVLFQNKNWDNEDLFLDTLLDIQSLGKTHYLLPTLSQITGNEDLPEKIKSLLE